MVETGGGESQRADKPQASRAFPVGPCCRHPTPKVVCVYGDEVPDIPTETRCETCGRVIPLRYVTIGYDINMKPADI